MPVKRTYWKLREIIREGARNAVVDTVRTCDVRGKTVHINCSSSIEAWRAGTYSTKEPETLDWIEQSVKPGDVLYDIGANIGLYSIYAALAQRTSKVYAFEPEALNFTRLLKNVLKNDVTEQVVPMHVALSDKTELGFLQLSELTAGAALHNFSGQGRGLREGIFATSLDELVSRFGLPFPNHMKVDVDGLEDRIFLGASKVLSNPALRSVLVELNDDETDSSIVHRELTKAGFKQLPRPKNQGASSNVFYSRGGA